jgi:spoIIIJ-associated protein
MSGEPDNGFETAPAAERTERGERSNRRERAPMRSESNTAIENEPAMPNEELATLAQTTTTDLLKAMGFEGTITAKAEGTSVEVTAEVADDEELLTGRKGETRQALQHLLTRMINRGEGSRYHLQLEINDFWQRRERELQGVARELAEEAVSSDSEVLTEYLNAQERRIVHVTLKEDPRVKTYAIGDGLIKKVAIAPADYPEGPPSES